MLETVHADTKARIPLVFIHCIYIPYMPSQGAAYLSCHWMLLLSPRALHLTSISSL